MKTSFRERYINYEKVFQRYRYVTELWKYILVLNE